MPGMQRVAAVLAGAGIALILLGTADALGAPGWIAPVGTGVYLLLAGLFAIDVDRPRPPRPPPDQEA
jgi:hypothetical protein